MTMSDSEHNRIKAILDFWFGADTAEFNLPRKAWWSRDESFDKQIRDYFADDHAQAVAGNLHLWAVIPEGALALVILLDQFSRNLNRQSPLAFAADPIARTVADKAIKEGLDQHVLPIRRQFFYMPFMHSEDIADQARSVVLFTTLDGLPDQQNSIDFAKRHEEIIRWFGRFPHRNAVLGRASTDEEIKFLSEPGSSF